MNSDFLFKLDSHRSREIFVKLIALDFNENPIEQIEGRATGGSINIDGASAVRRTCSISMVAKEMNINEFYWGLRSKFKLEIGLKNTVDNRYPDIIWFPQGVYVITSFNTNQTTNNYTVSISGKDKMCLLNGEIGGNLPASIDFGVEEYVDLENKTTIYNKIPIKNIIREALHTYANEPYHNIIIEDLEEAGLELLEYRGDTPIYLLYNTETHEYENSVLDKDKECYYNLEDEKSRTTISQLTEYYSRVDLVEQAVDIVYFKDAKKPTTPYKIAKLDFGMAAGYNITELTYAGDLISSIGETLTSILDKIKNMLGEFEYFYDLDGRFLFRRKKIFINTTFNNIINTQDDKYVENSAYNHQITYTFENGNLIASYQNAPNLANLRNDFSVWGNRKGINGDELPVHYRYAIDKKPVQYTNIEVLEEDIPGWLRNEGVKPQEGGIIYSNTKYDWREIIYQMAKDYYQYNRLSDFLFKVRDANKALYPTGKTGYEQYYIDMIGFWRNLYNPQAEQTVFDYTDNAIGDGKVFFKFNEKEYPYGLFVKKGYRIYNPETEEAGMSEDKIKEQRKKVFVLQQNSNTRYEMQPLLDSYKSDFNISTIKGEDNDYHQPEDAKYKFTVTRDNGFTPITKNILSRIEKSQIFVTETADIRNSIPLICYIPHTTTWYVEEEYEEPKKIDELLAIEGLSLLYRHSESEYYNYLPRTRLDIYGNETEDKKIYKTYIKYYYKDYEYYREEDNIPENVDPLLYRYWNKKITQAPDTLDFWIDFLDTEGELNQFAVPVVGDRPKVVNDKDVKSIYFRQVPDIIYRRPANDKKYETEYDLIKNADYWHYTMIHNLPLEYFNISGQGKSAQDVIEELLYNHSYCIESINVSSVPIYYLNPNTRILVRDDTSNIYGEYLVSRISIPLAYNGTMTINATKAPTRLF